MIHNKKGFTILELIVVICVIAILAGAIVISLMGYLNKAKKTVAIAECRNTVIAAQSVADELYTKNNYILDDLLDNKDYILQLSGSTGEIIELTCTENYSINYLLYYSSNNKYVQYKDGIYNVFDDIPITTTVEGYRIKSLQLLPQAIIQADNDVRLNTWTALRNLFSDTYGGNPHLTEYEQSLIDKPEISKNITWKPTLLGNKNGDDGILMIGSIDNSSVNNAYIIFYDNKYFYHVNEYGIQDSAWISDQGTFDVSNLINAPDVGSRWVKVEN